MYVCVIVVNSSALVPLGGVDPRVEVRRGRAGEGMLVGGHLLCFCLFSSRAVRGQFVC